MEHQNLRQLAQDFRNGTISFQSKTFHLWNESRYIPFPGIGQTPPPQFTFKSFIKKNECFINYGDYAKTNENIFSSTLRKFPQRGIDVYYSSQRELNLGLTKRRMLLQVPSFAIPEKGIYFHRENIFSSRNPVFVAKNTALVESPVFNTFIDFNPTKFLWQSNMLRKILYRDDIFPTRLYYYKDKLQILDLVAELVKARDRMRIHINTTFFNDSDLQDLKHATAIRFLASSHRVSVRTFINNIAETEAQYFISRSLNHYFSNKAYFKQVAPELLKFSLDKDNIFYRTHLPDGHMLKEGGARNEMPLPAIVKLVFLMDQAETRPQVARLGSQYYFQLYSPAISNALLSSSQIYTAEKLVNKFSSEDGDNPDISQQVYDELLSNTTSLELTVACIPFVSVNAYFNAFLVLSSLSSKLCEAIALLMGKISREQRAFFLRLFYLIKYLLLFFEFIVNWVLLPVCYPIKLILRPYMKPYKQQLK